MSKIDRKIKQQIEEWSKPIHIRIKEVSVRDIYQERNTPLTLDSRELHQAFVESKKKRWETRNESQGD